MPQTIPEKDRYRLRELGKEMVEIANSPEMIKLKQDWIAHNACRGERPMLLIEIGTFSNDVIPQFLKCESEEGRRIEWGMLQEYIPHKYFKDDTVIKDYYAFGPHTWFIPFGLDVKVTHTEGLGHHFEEVLHDLEDDFDMLGKSKFGHLKESDDKNLEFYSDLFDGVMPVKMKCGSQVLSAI